MFGLKTIVFRHSSIFGGRQYATADQGWIGWFVKQALDIKNGLLKEPFTISGTGKQVRDILFADDLINCYFAAIENIEFAKGNAFNIGGGADNSLSLLELFNKLGNILDINMNFTRLPVRQSDQKVYIADINKATSFFNWEPAINVNDGLQRMINWVETV
jgi:CDP-paratose 2-epimerase